MGKEFNLWDLPDYQLPNILWKKGVERGEAEKAYEAYELNRQIYLATLTEGFAKECKSHAEAERKARQTPEYGLFCKEMVEAKEEMIVARAKVSAVQAEIDMRKKRSYEDNREYRAGSLSP